MQKKYEISGVALETIGLFLLLIATFWENEYSGWWDTQSPEWQYWIQEEVNLATLYTLADLAVLATVTDQNLQNKIATDAKNRATEAAIRSITMRDERKKALKGQAELFSKIKLWLLISSAISLIIGKGLILMALLEKGR